MSSMYNKSYALRPAMTSMYFQNAFSCMKYIRFSFIMSKLFLFVSLYEKILIVIVLLYSSLWTCSYTSVGLQS